MKKIIAVQAHKPLPMVLLKEMMERLFKHLDIRNQFTPFLATTTLTPETKAWLIRVSRVVSQTEYSRVEQPFVLDFLSAIITKLEDFTKVPEQRKRSMFSCCLNRRAKKNTPEMLHTTFSQLHQSIKTHVGLPFPPEDTASTFNPMIVTHLKSLIPDDLPPSDTRLRKNPLTQTHTVLTKRDPQGKRISFAILNEHLIDRFDKERTVIRFAIDLNSNRRYVVKKFPFESKEEGQGFDQEKLFFQQFSHRSFGTTRGVAVFECEGNKGKQNGYVIYPEYGFSYKPNTVWRDAHECLNNDTLEGLTFKQPLAKHIFAKTLKATLQLHTLGVFHRDIKPENVFLDRFGHPLLSDFEFITTEKNRDGIVRGTPGFIYPHIPSKGHNSTVDHWALGATLFAMCRPHYLSEAIGEIGMRSARCSLANWNLWLNDEVQEIKSIIQLFTVDQTRLSTCMPYVLATLSKWELSDNDAMALLLAHGRAAAA